MLHFVNCFNWTSFRGWVTRCTSWLWYLLYRISLLRRGSPMRNFSSNNIGFGRARGELGLEGTFERERGELGLGGCAGKDGERERPSFPARCRFSLSPVLPPRNFYSQSSSKEASAEERGIECKMPNYIGYWPKLRWWLGIDQDLFYLLMDRGAGEVHKHVTKGLYQYPAILTEQGLVWKVFIIIMTNRAPVPGLQDTATNKKAEGQYLGNKKHVPCFYRVIETQVEVWENEKYCGNECFHSFFEFS